PIKLPIPEVLIVPGVFADRQRNFGVAELDQLLLLGRSEISGLVEDVIGRKQALGLDEGNAAIAQQGRRIHHALAGARLGWAGESGDYGDPFGCCGHFLQSRLIACKERRLLDEIARWVAADAEFSKKNEIGATVASAR